MYYTKSVIKFKLLQSSNMHTQEERRSLVVVCVHVKFTWSKRPWQTTMMKDKTNYCFANVSILLTCFCCSSWSLPQPYIMPPKLTKLCWDGRKTLLSP